MRIKVTKYVEWQNRAFHFYLAARLLYVKQHIVPAAFCAQQALELILKATLIYHDKSFIPTAVNHNFKKMMNILKNKVKNSNHINIPEYFYYDYQYQSYTRYPSEKEGLFLPENMLTDLDKCFSDLLLLVPFQSGTLLENTLYAGSPKLKSKLNLFRRKQTDGEYQKTLKRN